tara:strand:+ start:727 stop:1089 length:363 start_codon:yes stop_codon:yes gene_type:complete
MATMKDLDAWVLKGGPGFRLTKTQAQDYRSKPPQERRRIAESFERDVWMKRDPKMQLAEESWSLREGNKLVKVRGDSYGLGGRSSFNRMVTKPKKPKRRAAPKKNQSFSESTIDAMLREI